jgi:hypothetical protein
MIPLRFGTEAAIIRRSAQFAQILVDAMINVTMLRSKLTSRIR